MALVKLCCITNHAELHAAIAAKPDAIGFVGRALSGPEVIDDDTVIAQLADQVPREIARVLLLRDTDSDTIIARARATRIDTLQLIEPLAHDVLDRVRNALGETKLWTVIHVRSREAIDEASRAARLADAIVLDSGSPEQGVYGGSGALHDWSISAEIARELAVPVWLAGGLRAELLPDAFARVQPAGFDVCSGIRTEGVLDADKAARFVRVAHGLQIK